jgi:hypothetical protein
VFAAPLHGNGRYSIVACVFVAAGNVFTESLPSNDCTIPALGRHVTTCIYYNPRFRFKENFLEMSMKEGKQKY